MERFADKIDNYRGLTSDEAAERLIMYGYNCDSRTLETSGDFKPAGSMFSLRFILMALAAVIILLCGRTGEGFVMLLLAFIYSATEIFKGMKCRDTFKELRRISGARFRVLRDGNISLLRREYIVPDDIIILQEGENVPADAHILEAQGVFADEFLFTGDRTPSSKRTGVDSKNDVKQTCLYKGTRLLSGNAVARVVATGIDTKKCRDFGEEYENEAKTYVTGIEAAINGLMPVFYLASGAFLVLFFIITFSNWKSDPSLSLGEAFRSLSAASLLPAFAFALCLIPAECPRLVRAHYLYGAFSLLKRNCIVKDLNAMASLSAITAVCVDKTGIITKTHTSLVDEYTTDADALSRISVLSCDQSGSPDASALDRAIILGAAFKGTDVKALHENELIRRYPFSEEAKLGGSLWDINGSLLLCIKGSPETVLTKCSNLQPDYLFSVQQKQQKYAAQGHRVVAVAYARVDADSIPDDAYDAEYTFVGLAAFANQTRDSAPAAVRSCYRAGVKVIMTTGDSPEAALTIGRKIGLTEGLALTGDYLRECRMNGVKPDITDVNIFARVTPDQKTYIIDLLRDRGDVVAATGIGAADVEALEAADVGVALPQETSGAAKEACGLVLADDDFNSVVDALKETRQIHYNIKQTIGMAICALTALLMYVLFNLFSGGYAAMSPIAVSLPSVILLPLLSLAFFGNRADIKGMMSASGFIGRRALDVRFLIRAITQGLCASLVVLIFRLIFWGESPEVLNSCFLAVLAGGLGSGVFVNLSANIPCYRLINAKIGTPLLIIGATLLLVTLLIYLPVVNAAFGLAPISILRFIAAMLLGIASQAWVEIPKIRDEQKGATL